MEDIDLCRLEAGDEALVESFLAAHQDSSLHLLNNLRLGGLEDRGERHQGTWVAAVQGDRILAVLGHFWNGLIIPQAPVHLEPLLWYLVEESGRFIRGVHGPQDQVDRALVFLGLTASPPEAVAMDETEVLLRLDLAQLPLLAPQGTLGVQSRRAALPDLAAVTAQRSAFMVETYGLPAGPALDAASREAAGELMAHGRLWVLERNGDLVASQALSAVLDTRVLVGASYTAPRFRGRGYGRSVVAAALRGLHPGAASVGFVLVAERNLPSRRMFQSLGFQQTDSFRMFMLRSTGADDGGFTPG